MQKNDTKDTRNVLDEFKGQTEADIIRQLDTRGVSLEIAIENITRDFSMGSIVRSANAFGIRRVHIIGSRQWNKRGAMKTDAYLHIHYYNTPQDFFDHIQKKTLIAVDNNVKNTVNLNVAKLPKDCVLIFGAEGSGLSKKILEHADHAVTIEQLGSTRSLNVGVAAGIVMYEWLRRFYLTES